MISRLKNRPTSWIMLAAIAASLVFILPVFLQSAAAQSVSTTNNISNNTGVSTSPHMVQSGDNVYVAWQDFTPGNFEILFAASTDGGVTFSDPINISNRTDGFSSTPRVAATGDNIYVVWHDILANDIFVVSSTDSGITFSDPVNVSNTGASSPPQIAASEDSVYLVWGDSSPGNFDIFLATSTDGGDTFSDPTNISNNTEGFSFLPQIAHSTNGTINVVWQDTSPSDDIFLATSTDGGDTFSDSINISNLPDGASSAPVMGVSGDQVYVAWQDSFPANDIFVVSSTDGGSSFDDPVNISDNGGNSVSPVLTVSDTEESSVFVSWIDDTDTGGFFDVFFAASTDGGSSFSNSTNVSNNPGQTLTTPQVAVDGSGTAFVSWSDDTLDVSNSEVFLAGSADGVDFGCTVNVSNNPTGSFLAQLLVSPSNGNLSILWYDAIDPIDPGNFDIILRSDFTLSSAPIIIDTVTNTSPKWGIDSVGVSGTAGDAAEGDSVTVDWGDGTIDSDIPVSGCAWGPVEHTYTSSALSGNNNSSELTAELISEEGDAKAISEPTEISVQKHVTSVEMDPVLSVRQGSNVTASGIVTDADTGDGIEGLTVIFDGTGAEFAVLEPVLTDADGSFSSTGTTADAQDGLAVQAHYAGDEIFESSDSAVSFYDSIPSSAVQFNVTAGPESHLDLSGFSFDASLDFENVVSDGALFVSECTASNSTRYTPMDICLQISSAVDMADGTLATITMSFAGKDLPAGSTAADVDLFHEQASLGGTTIVDITGSRSEAGQTVSGNVTTFSKFIAAVAVHTAPEAGSQRHQILIGDGNNVSLRDINNLVNSSATVNATFDDTSYTLSDRPVLTITDANGNLDANQTDIVLAAVMSDTSTPINIIISLTETGTDTGIFSGDFGLDSDLTSSELGVVQIAPGDALSAFYISGVRAHVLIDGVVESGVVDMSDFIVEEGVCLKPLGGAFNLELLDSQLGPDGKITVTISYANANLRGFDPSSFRMVHKQDATWIDITLPDPDGHDLDAMMVTGETSTAGPFSLAVELDDCSGGAGGGLGRPGAGLVLDFVASLAASSPGGGGGGGGGGGAGSGSTPIATAQIDSGEDIASEIDLSETSDVLEVQFENVLSGGSINVIEQQPYELPSGTFSSTGLTGTLSVDGSESETAGTIFDIDSSAGLIYNGTVDITIPYDPALVSTQSDDVRFLQYNGTAWEDVTVHVNNANNTVTGRLSSLSPVVAATVSDGTFAPLYFEENPLSKASVAELALRDEEGGNATQVVKGETVVIGTSITNVQRVEQSYSYFVQVLDQNGVTVSLNSSTGSLSKAEIVKAEQSWTSALIDEPGNYTVKVYVWSQSDGSGVPIPLSEAMTQTIRVLEG